MNKNLKGFEYLGKTKSDNKPTFETKQIDVAKMKAVRIDKKTIKLIKKRHHKRKLNN